MADLGCPPNAAIAFDYLVGKGLRDFQAAAVIGNLQQESRLDPRNDAPDPTKTDPSARGRGIASWGPPRWQNLLAFAAQTGRDPWSLDLQLDFLWYELQATPSIGLTPLRATTTLADATIVFQNKFERPDPARAHTDRRIELANATLYACPAVKSPFSTPRAGIVAAAAGVLALVATAGYGVYRALATRTPEPEPEPEPRPKPRPIFPPPIPRRPQPVFRRAP